MATRNNIILPQHKDISEALWHDIVVILGGERPSTRREVGVFADYPALYLDNMFKRGANNKTERVKGFKLIRDLNKIWDIVEKHEGIEGLDELDRTISEVAKSIIDIYSNHGKPFSGDTKEMVDILSRIFINSIAVDGGFWREPVGTNNVTRTISNFGKILNDTGMFGAQVIRDLEKGKLSIIKDKNGKSYIDDGNTTETPTSQNQPQDAKKVKDETSNVKVAQSVKQSPEVTDSVDVASSKTPQNDNANIADNTDSNNPTNTNINTTTNTNNTNTTSSSQTQSPASTGTSSVTGNRTVITPNRRFSSYNSADVIIGQPGAENVDNVSGQTQMYRIIGPSNSSKKPRVYCNPENKSAEYRVNLNGQPAVKVKLAKTNTDYSMDLYFLSKADAQAVLDKLRAKPEYTNKIDGYNLEIVPENVRTQGYFKVRTEFGDFYVLASSFKEEIQESMYTKRPFKERKDLSLKETYEWLDSLEPVEAISYIDNILKYY